MSSDPGQFPPASNAPPRGPGVLQRPPRRPAPRVGGNGSFRLFRVWGITVFLHWSWFLVAIWMIERNSSQYHSLVWGVVEYLALFVIVLMHEFGHALACRSVGGKAERIMLWPLGGVAFVSPPPRPGAVLWSIAAGPLVNVALLPITYALYRAFEHQPGDFATLTKWIMIINGVLLAFNLLPIYPLDGGQILQSLLWFVIGRARSLMVSAWVGILGAAALLAYALYTQDIWLIVLAGFGGWQAWIGIKYAQRLLVLQRAPRRAGAVCPNCGKAPPAGPFWRCPCGAQFDTFENAGICPHCGRQFQITQCLECGRPAPYAAWHT